MSTKKQKPFGLWPSPITAESLAGNLRLEDAQYDHDSTVVWLEAVDGKTSLIAKKRTDAPRTLSTGIKIGGTVGYGGGEFTVSNGTVVFAAKNRLYKLAVAGGYPQAIMPEFGDVASPAISPDGTRVLFVSSIDRVDCLALVPMDGSAWPNKIAQGADFYMQPTWHPNNMIIAWVEWDHPQMPWDGCRLMIGAVDEDGKCQATHVFGGPDLPVFQPVFSPNGRYLAFVAADGDTDAIMLMDLESKQIKKIVTGKVLLEPAWVQGMRSIAWSPESDAVFFLSNEKNKRFIEKVELTGYKVTRIDNGAYTWVKQIHISPEDGSLLAITANPKTSDRIVQLAQGGAATIIRRASAENTPAGFLQDPQAIEWQAPDGSIVHGLFYAPLSETHTSEGLPPAVISVHGGPTSARVWEFSAQALFFTSRGYAYMEVNHRGSTGYGREYMLKLRRNWGKVDVEDAAGGAKALAALGLADADRMVVMGGSAGGYTVLNSLIQCPGVFKAGVNFYGVANLFDFLIGTHKFEERYNDSMVGILPEAAERYKAWSPVFHAEKIKDPLAVFQGEIDKVVPREHSDQIVAHLVANKVPHIYHLYAGEGHGFRKAESIADFYNSIHTFLLAHVLF